jgi:tRNA (cytidine56-2'-O)-methyltransferase
MKVVVLRLGHRPLRDRRVTTHVALAARAFGASGMVMDTPDERVEESVRDVVERWGGEFFIESASWKSYLRKWGGLKVHLTMYGLPVDQVIDEIRDAKKDILVIVGAEKVPGEVFEKADYNVAVTNQPHSEVSALAVFLDRLYQGRELQKDFGGKYRIIPSDRSKRILKC